MTIVVETLAIDASKAAPRSRDPFALELIKNALVALADEMALTVYRTARSFVVKEALDFSTALFLADGQLIAQGTCLPFHLGAMPFAVRSVVRAYKDRILPGDLFITNDPYDGSTHLPDIVLVDAFRVPDLPMAQRGVLHGDRRCSAIAAAGSGSVSPCASPSQGGHRSATCTRP